MGFPGTGNISLSPKVSLWDKKKTCQETKLKFMDFFLCIFSHFVLGEQVSILYKLPNLPYLVHFYCE